MKLSIDSQPVLQELETLATFSDVPAPAVTRIVFSETDRRARAYVKALCEAAGLQVRHDAVGNTFARWVARRRTSLPSGPARILTPFRTLAAMTGLLVCSAAWRRSAR